MRDGLIWLERARHKLLVQFSAGKGEPEAGAKIPSPLTLTLTLSRLRGKNPPQQLPPLVGASS